MAAVSSGRWLLAGVGSRLCREDYAGNVCCRGSVWTMHSQRLVAIYCLRTAGAWRVNLVSNKCNGLCHRRHSVCCVRVPALLLVAK